MVLLIALTGFFADEVLLARSQSANGGQLLSYELTRIRGNARQTQRIQLPDGPWARTRIGRNCIVASRSTESSALSIFWEHNRTSAVPLQHPADDIRLCQGARYLQVTERLAKGKEYQTEVFRLDGVSARRILIEPGKGCAIVEDHLLVSSSEDGKHLKFSVKALDTRKGNTPFGKKLLALAQSRQLYWSKDPYRSYGNGDIRPPISMDRMQDSLIVSPLGDYWFEKSLREYVVEGIDTSRFFAGHVIIDKLGMKGQWKFNRDSMHGAYFVSPGVLRALWTEKFLYGKKKLDWYKPGIYDLDMKRNKLSEVHVPGLSPSDFGQEYLIEPN